MKKEVQQKKDIKEGIDKKRRGVKRGTKKDKGKEKIKDDADDEDDEEQEVKLSGDKNSLSQQCIANYHNRSYKPEYTPAGKYKYCPPETFEVEEWDPNDLPTDKCISMLWIGKRRTGKSYGERWYMSMRNDNDPDDIKEVYVFTGSKENGWYQQFLPDQYIYPGWFPEICKAIENRGGDIRKRSNRQVGDPPNGEQAGIVLLMDDLLSTKGVRNSSEIEELYTKGRHFDCEVHFLTQKFNGLPPKIRCNTDIVIIFTVFDDVDKQLMIDEFFSRMNRQTASELIDMYTDGEMHTGLVIETWRNDTDPNHYLKVFKAWDPKLKPGTIGSEEYWEAALKNQGNVDNSDSFLADGTNYRKEGAAALSFF